MEVTKVPTERGMDKEDVIYMKQYYSYIKKNEILPVATTWMDLQCIMLNEVSPTEKDKYRTVSLTCTISTEEMNKFGDKFGH